MTQVDKNKKVCANCAYWQDYGQRVWALVEGHTQNTLRGDELRLCKYRPPPSANSNNGSKYTSEDWYCSAFTAPAELDK
jgi:hypothetical protein